MAEALLTCVEDQYLPGVINRARRIPTRLNAGFRVKTEAVFPPADLPTSAGEKTTDPPARSKTKRTHEKRPLTNKIEQSHRSDR